MINPHIEGLISTIHELDFNELRSLEVAVRVALQMRSQSNLSTDTPTMAQHDEEGPGLHDQAREILENATTYELTLADQALLGALMLSDGYEQDSFSSRDINDVIAECGRPRIAHITSAIAGLTNRSYLHVSEKTLSLTREGRAKARGLIGMIKRRASAA